jgi:1,4-alpha-glucan branching enzyme
MLFITTLEVSLQEAKLMTICIYYFDRLPDLGNKNDSLYFTDQDRETGGLAFALGNDPLSQLLLDNAPFFIEEYHVNGFRYDEISVLLSTNQGSADRKR